VEKMNWLYITWLVAQFTIYMLIFYRMSITNKEEWRYTQYMKGSLIGAIVGFIVGGLTGYTLYRVNGLYLGASYGLLLGALAFIINLFLFNRRMKEEKEFILKMNKKNFSK
jgi:hypothetical protein